MTRAQRIHLVAVTAVSAVAAAATLALTTGAMAAGDYTFDTGAGVVFTISSTNGSMTSLKHNGVELAAPHYAAGQFESGWGSATVTEQTFNSGKAVLISATNDGITQYYFARQGDDNIYMATNIATGIGEGRFIARLNSALLPTSTTAADTSAATGSVEGKDVFSLANGHTASKFYSSQRLIAQKPYGARGNGVGVYLLDGTNEMSSGGPFFRDIEVNKAGPTTTNLTNYLYSGHAQTEPLRLGLHGPYAMAITNGAKPTAVNLDFLSKYIPGLLSVAQRGKVTGTATGTWRGLTGTVALAGPNGQYWGAVKKGRFTIDKIRPGTYTATLYAGEIAVGAEKTVTVQAGTTSKLAMKGSNPKPGTIFQIGVFDGTPKGFLNANGIQTEHPSDVRMSNWKVGTFTVGSPVSGFPMDLFQGVNSPLTVDFTLASVPAAGATLRIATTLAFAGGRPAISVGGWSSNLNLSPAPVDLNSRGVTRGTWRGVNATYTFTIPPGALKVGTNSLVINTISGSGGDGFLSPNFVFDALALDPV